MAPDHYFYLNEITEEVCNKSTAKFALKTHLNYTTVSHETRFITYASMYLLTMESNMDPF